MILKGLVLAALVVAVVALIGLAAMSAVASSHDIVVVPVPERMQILGLAGGADYADAYVGPMEYLVYTEIDQVEEKAFQKGELVHRDESELVYRGKGPGYHWYISYMLDNTVNPQTLTVATAIKYEGTFGKWFWKFARPIHYLLVPVRLDRMLQDAPRN